ncbi:protein YgfX [Chitinimonas sp.]|uniref:protein YgfX n=1 Tax=Chitinimonas sp. TaxID=1934313 RepID=UPI0035B01FE9
MRTLPPLRILLRRSRLEVAGLVTIHGLGLGMPWLAALPQIVRWLVCALVCASAAYHGWRFRQPYPVEIRLLPDGRWALLLAGDEQEGSLLPGSYLTQALQVLHFRLDSGKPIRIAVWPDSASPEQRRRLRVWLRWGQAAVRSSHDHLESLLHRP